MEIPVRIVDHRPIATLTLNGTDVPMLVDSGAFFSFLTESTAARLKLPLHRLPDGVRLEGYAGRVQGRLTRVEKVGLLGAQLKSIEFVVGGNELGSGIGGILGRNILSIADSEYDLAQGVVRLVFPKGECAKANLAYWAGKAPVVEVPLDRNWNGDDRVIQVEVRINGKANVAVLDTGAPTTALALGAARRAGIEESRLAPSGRVGGAGEGKVKSWMGEVAAFEVGGEKISASRLQINDIEDGDVGVVLGLDYFLSHRIYVSRLQRKVYITWNGTPIFEDAGSTRGTYDTRYAALPQALATDDADALARRGAAAIAAGDYARALDDLNRACELAPTVAENFFARARLHLAQQRLPHALADLDETLRLDPALAEARSRRAWVQASLGEHERARADLAHLDLAEPPSSHLRAAMGDLYARFDQAGEALKQFDLWLTSHPNDAQRARVLNSRCWLRARLGIDLPLALQDCKDAVDVDGGSAAYRDSLGWTYLRMGDGARAKKAFDAGIRVETLAFSFYGRGLARLRLDDAAGGEQDLAAARRLDPTIDEAVRKAGFDGLQGVRRPGTPGPTP
ncbi:MAG: hypothetical protein RL375_2480 [Pseudomonadota bacterium]